MDDMDFLLMCEILEEDEFDDMLDEIRRFPEDAIDILHRNGYHRRRDFAWHQWEKLQKTCQPMGVYINEYNL
ncbi:MAG: hypothetical protein Q4C54_02420 [Clostridia bacterium]|nr:hypothetical protein [Clostridia bacterium]